VTELVRSGPGLRKASPSSSPPVAVSPAFDDEACNQQAKREFRALVRRVLGRQSIREQAAFFGVPHSTYNERIANRRVEIWRHSTRGLRSSSGTRSGSSSTPNLRGRLDGLFIFTTPYAYSNRFASQRKVPERISARAHRNTVRACATAQSAVQ
jgi:hypothetical protein